MTYSATVLADGPCGYWYCDEGSGTTAIDYSGSGLNATNDAGVTVAARAAIAGVPATTAYGGNSTAECDYFTSGTGFPSGSGNYTGEMWFYVTSTSFSIRGMAWGDPTAGSGHQVTVTPRQDTTSVRVTWNSVSTLSYTVPSGFTNQWHHLVGTWDGTHRLLYLDGAQVASDTPSAASLHQSYNISQPCYFCVQNDYWCHVAVYASCLSAARVLAHYNAGIAAGGGGGPGTALWLPSYPDMPPSRPGAGHLAPSPQMGPLPQPNPPGSPFGGLWLPTYPDHIRRVWSGAHLLPASVAPTKTPPAQFPGGSPVSVTASNTCLDLTEAPLAFQPVTITLRAPLNSQSIVIASTGHAITRTSITIQTDASGAWSQTLAGLDTLSPAGCVYQFDEPGGKTTIASASDFFAGSLVVGTLYPARPTLNLLKMALTALDIAALADQGSVFTVALDQDAEWTGGAGIGQLLNSGKSFQVVTDLTGNLAVYLVRTSELSVPTALYRITNNRTQTSRTFRCPTAYTNDAGVWAVSTVFAAGMVARRPADDVPFLSLKSGNIGNPLTDPTSWVEYAGEKIANYETAPVGAGVSVTETTVLTSNPGAVAHPVPTTLKDDLEEILYELRLGQAPTYNPQPVHHPTPAVQKDDVEEIKYQLQLALALIRELQPLVASVGLDKWLPSVPDILFAPPRWAFTYPHHVGPISTSFVERTQVDKWLPSLPHLVQRGTPSRAHLLPAQPVGKLQFP